MLLKLKYLFFVVYFALYIIKQQLAYPLPLRRNFASLNLFRFNLISGQIGRINNCIRDPLERRLKTIVLSNWIFPLTNCRQKKVDITILILIFSRISSQINITEIHMQRCLKKFICCKLRDNLRKRTNTISRLNG